MATSLRIVVVADAVVQLDYLAAVVYAPASGHKVIDTLGLLALAWWGGLVGRVAPLIAQLQAGGHYLGANSVGAALRAAGEGPA